LPGRLKFTIPNLQIYLPKRANSEKLGLGIDNPCKIVFLSLQMNKCLKRVNDRQFWNPGVFSYSMIPDVASTQEFFFIVTSMVVFGAVRDFDVTGKTFTSSFKEIHRFIRLHSSRTIQEMTLK
jgi:hypothetical protein